jgi:hypothetical protein
MVVLVALAVTVVHQVVVNPLEPRLLLPVLAVLEAPVLRRMVEGSLDEFLEQLRLCVSRTQTLREM